MSRRLLLATVLALALAACSQSQVAPTPTPTAGCPEPTRVTGLTPTDVSNLATWKQDLANGVACDKATSDYVTRLEDKKSEQLFANASTFAMIGRVTDAVSGAPVEQVCITPGKPGAICWSRTDRDGWYLLDLGSVFDLAVVLRSTCETTIAGNKRGSAQARHDRIERVVRGEPIAQRKRLGDHGHDRDPLQAERPQSEQSREGVIDDDLSTLRQPSDRGKHLGVEVHGHARQLVPQDRGD